MPINTLPHTFVETYLGHINMIKFIGIDIFDLSEKESVRKYIKSSVILGITIFMLVGQILYVVKKDEIGAQFLEVVSAIPSILGVGQVLLKASLVTLLLFELLPLAKTIYDFNTKADAQYQFTVKTYFFHYLDSHILYAIAYIYEAITCTTAYLCVYIASELLLVALILDLGALFTLLKIDLEDIVQSSVLQPLDEEDNCDDIKHIVTLHQELLSIADDVNRIFGMIIFTQVSFTSIVICCYGFMALLANGMFLNYMAAAIGVMFEIFILSYPGQILTNTSENLGNAAYSCHWYDRGIKFRKYIVIIIIRSQKPCLMSALGFSDLTLEMFAKVMSTSWSYLSLLNQMYKEL